MHGQIRRSLAQLIIGVGAKVIKLATSNESPSKKRDFKDSNQKEPEPIVVLNAMIPEEVPKVVQEEVLAQPETPIEVTGYLYEDLHVTLKSITLSDAAKEVQVIEEVPLVLVDILQGTPQDTETPKTDPDAPKTLEFTCTEEVILGNHCNKEAVQVLGAMVRETDSQPPKDPHSSIRHHTWYLSCYQVLQGLLEKNGSTLTEILSSTKGKATSSRSLHRSCTDLIQQGVVRMEGQGGTQDPYRYHLNVDPYKVIELLADFESKMGSSSSLVS